MADLLKILNEKDFKKVEACENELHKAIMMSLYYLGTRITEFLNLKVSDVMWDDGEIKDAVTIKTLKKREYKTGKKAGKKTQKDCVREIPLNDDAKKYILFLIDDAKDKLKKRFSFDSPLVISQKRTPMTRQHISLIIRRFREANKIQTKLTPHTLRHQCISAILQNGGSVMDAKYIAGHESVTTTLEIYAHSTTESINRAMNSLSRRVKR